MARSVTETMSMCAIHFNQIKPGNWTQVSAIIETERAYKWASFLGLVSLYRGPPHFPSMTLIVVDHIVNGTAG